MSKEKYNQIIDEAYENYFNNFLGYDDVPTKEVFVFECKTDKEFSERWGLKIEERELSRDERIDLYCIEYTAGIRGKYEKPFDDFIDAKLTTRNIPTKLITAVYQNEKIEVYE